MVLYSSVTSVFRLLGCGNVLFSSLGDGMCCQSLFTHHLADWCCGAIGLLLLKADKFAVSCV